MLWQAVESACRAGYTHIRTAGGVEGLVRWLMRWPAGMVDRGWRFDPARPAVVCDGDAERGAIPAVFPVE